MKPRIFLDTNVVIDYLAARAPFGEAAYQIFLRNQNFDLCISALSFTTVYYVLRKECGHEKLLDIINKLLTIVTILPVDSDIVKNAAKSEFADFEDAVQYFTARTANSDYITANSDYIITRNVKDYKLSEINIMTPMEFLQKTDGDPKG